MNESISEILHEKGIKIDFWYQQGELDAVCIAKRDGQNLTFKKQYSVDEIARLVYQDYEKELL